MNALKNLPFAYFGTGLGIMILRHINGSIFKAITFNIDAKELITLQDFVQAKS